MQLIRPLPFVLGLFTTGITKQMIQSHFLQVAFLSIALTIVLPSCGGGGGGGGDNSGSGSSGGGGSVPDYSISYVGASNQATLTRQNAIPYLSMSYEMIEAATTMAEIVDYVAQPNFLVPESGANLSDECERGSFSVDDQRAKNSSAGRVSFTFRNCVLDETEFSGRIVVDIEDKRSEGYPYSVEVIGLKQIDDTDELILDGTVRYHRDRGVSTDELVVHSSQLNKYFKLAEFSYSYPQMSGKLYDSMVGWIVFSQQIGTDLITFKGGNDSQLIATYDDFRFRHSEDEAIFELVFTDGASTGATPVALTTTISVATLRAYSYGANTAPVSTVATTVNAQRLANKKLVAKGSDSQSDFLSYRWQHVSAPEDCEFELTEIDHGIVNLVSQCQGQHQLRLFVFDGFTESSAVVTVNVNPLPAEVDTITEVQLGLNESLDMTLGVPNSATDGPFTYKLAYGPAGISVDSSGRITGRPQHFVSSGLEEFVIGVKVDNGHSATALLKVSMESPAPERTLLPSMEVCHYNRPKWADIDGNGKPDLLCPMADSYSLLEVDGNEINLVYTELSPPSYSELNSLAQYDMNSDGIDEIVLGYEAQVYVIDGANRTTIRTVDLPFSTEDYYYSNYTIYQPDYSLNGLLLRVNGGDDEGYYLVEFGPGDDNVVTKLPSGNFDFSFVSNLDGDAPPEFLSHNGLQLLQIDGTATDLPSRVNYMADMDGDGATELVYLSNGGDYRSKEFELRITDPTTLVTTLSQTLTIPASYTEIWAPSAYIVNVDEDPEKEIVLHFGSIYKLFVFDYDGSQYVLTGEVGIPEEGDNTLASVKQLDHGRVFVALKGWPERYYSYSVADGLSGMHKTSPQFTDHLANRFDVSNTYLTPSGNVEFFYPIVKLNRKLTLGRVEIDPNGLLIAAKETTLPAPYNMDALVVGGITAPGQHEILLTHDMNSGRGYQVYDIDLEQLISETTFTPEVAWPAMFFTTDVDNDGDMDIFAYANGGATPLTWIDPINDRLLWSLESAGFYPVVSGLLAADFDGNGVPELMMVRGTMNLERQLHVYEWNGTEFETRFAYTYDAGFPSPFMFASLALQDVDGDGKQEIIIASTDSDCDEYTSNRILVIDDDFTVLADSVTTACIQSVPTFAPGKTGGNLIVVSKTDIPDPGQENSRRGYTQFEELDIHSGSSIWKSSPFFGLLEPESLVFFGEPSAGRKAILSLYGIYTFR